MPVTTGLQTVGFGDEYQDILFGASSSGGDWRYPKVDRCPIRKRRNDRPGRSR